MTTAPSPSPPADRKKYRTICADPPWPVVGDGDALFRPWCGKGGRRGHDTFFPYEVQPLDWIASLPVSDLAESDAHLYLWAPAKLNREGAGLATVRAWGFECVSEIVWAKPNFGLGKFPRPQHEITLICRRGSLPFDANNEGSVQDWGPRRRHSEKPDRSFDLWEKVSPGPYIELFARRQRFGWDSWGRECRCDIDLTAGEDR